MSTLLVLVDAALKVEVMPTGSPETVRATLLLKLFCPCTLMVEITFVPPTRAVSAVAEVERLKVGLGMLKLMEVVAVKRPEVA